MHSITGLVYTLLSLAPLAARADLQLDADDVSTACQSICRPVTELSQICDVEDDQVGGQPTEDNLTLQCYCLNTSFDVGNITPLCQSCMSQNPQVDDDDDDANDQADDLQYINEVVSRCGFTQATYAADQANTANGIVVAATRPTAANQLTTTVVAGAGATQTTGTIATTDGTTSTTRTPGTTATGTGASAATTTGVTMSGASDLNSSVGGWANLLTYVVCAAGLGAWAM